MRGKQCTSNYSEIFRPWKLLTMALWTDRGPAPVGGEKKRFFYVQLQLNKLWNLTHSARVPPHWSVFSGANLHFYTQNGKGESLLTHETGNSLQWLGIQSLVLRWTHGSRWTQCPVSITWGVKLLLKFCFVWSECFHVLNTDPGY